MPGEIEFAQGSDSQLLDCGGHRGVVKRAQHSGHISQCSALDPALTQGTGRLAFEVDDREILAGVQNLPEMQVAMNAHTHDAQSAMAKSLESREDLVLMRNDQLHLITQILRNV